MSTFQQLNSPQRLMQPNTKEFRVDIYSVQEVVSLQHRLIIFYMHHLYQLNHGVLIIFYMHHLHQLNCGVLSLFFTLLPFWKSLVYNILFMWIVNHVSYLSDSCWTAEIPFRYSTVVQNIFYGTTSYFSCYSILYSTSQAFLVFWFILPLILSGSF